MKSRGKKKPSLRKKALLKHIFTLALWNDFDNWNFIREKVEIILNAYKTAEDHLYYFISLNVSSHLSYTTATAPLSTLDSNYAFNL